MQKLEYNPNRQVVSGCLHPNGDLDIVFNTGEQITITAEEIIMNGIDDTVACCEEAQGGTMVKFLDNTEIFVPHILI